ncbi:MAG: fumarylacetoacetate hydrolase family protein [Pseudomonadota bacterium]
MRLVSFIHEDRPSYGLSVDGDTFRLPEATYRRFPDLATLLGHNGQSDPELVKPSGKVTPDALLPPIPAPGKILCVGVNYLPHIREMGREPPDKPLVFVRFANSVVGHGAALAMPPNSEHYDFEGELALVIGKRCQRVAREDTEAVIAGFMPFMDGSVRDFQRHTTQFTAGKNFWRSGAAGPALVTPDEVGDVRQLRLETRLNGELMQSASVGDLVFDVPALVAYCSSFTRLEPGDVIVTGTPGGVGAARTPPVWLKPGDRLEVDLGRAGTLANVVEPESGPLV